VLRPEVSFSIWGERGVLDVLAWHVEQRALLVVELKTELIDIGELLATLDRKRRLAPLVAKDLGWLSDSASTCVLLPDHRTNHRRLAQHAAVLRAALPADGRGLRRWLAHPAGPIHALAFLPDSPATTTGNESRGTQRVRARPRPAPALTFVRAATPDGRAILAESAVTAPGASLRVTTGGSGRKQGF
jgi:hypothetical protein